ncbi:hypothetical protein M6B38_383475 [Iris pallida]|uniref:Uncharacterized protein n=1 Tax=Iris pallida TaxID=29817 RepID=A0AAX6G4I0_IRIPA|nr:hypothetical protein M6B38_383475 [Iris pallida]
MNPYQIHRTKNVHVEPLFTCSKINFETPWDLWKEEVGNFF